jgi:hypothetical protein
MFRMFRDIICSITRQHFDGSEAFASAATLHGTFARKFGNSFRISF